MSDRWHWLKETWCFLWGHDWKSSWRNRADREWAIRLSDAEAKIALPYGRRMSGNYLCENSEGWHYKCRRCRQRTRGDSWLPWHRDLWYAAQNFGRCWWIVASGYWPWPKRVEGRGYTVYPWWTLPLTLCLAPLFAFAQSWGYAWMRGWPSWPMSLAFWLQDKPMWWMEDRGIRYDWMPPDSGHPLEVGFWQRRLDGESPFGRARIYVSSGGGHNVAESVIDATGSTHSWSVIPSEGPPTRDVNG